MPAPHTEPREQINRPRGDLRTRPRSRGNYTQHCDIVYAETEGMGLVMDVFQPAGPANGRAIVDVIASAWRSDRTCLNQHIGLGAIDAFCEAGFTVFAVTPGSATLFTGREMIGHLHAAIRHIRSEASAWDIEPAPLGLCGVSAGGHLAALCALQPQPAAHRARQPWYRHSTEVAAVGLFFPPTDFLDYEGRHFDFGRSGENAVPRLLFADGLAGRSEAEIETEARAISPFHHVAGGHPPFFIAHATADAVVPYSQSERFARKLAQADTEVTLVTHEGPGHPWPTIGETCSEMAAWFSTNLGK